MKTKIASAFLLCAFLVACTHENQVNSALSESMPAKIVWAWERPEDLRFLDPKEFGVAFLAQTIFLEAEAVLPRPRRQPLEVAPGAYVIAVTRIETNKDGRMRPTFSAEMASKAALLVSKTLELPNVKAVQIDFDAVKSERDFYRTMMNDLKRRLPTGTPLTMTSLASWCTGDAWFNDFPVDEAVPMAFQMGADNDKIRAFLRNGNDWREPLCRGSYGISLEEGRPEGIKTSRRMYYFKNTPWTSESMSKLP